MNTISLVLNGKTAAYIRSLPEKERSSITTLARPHGTAAHKRRPSEYSDDFSIGSPAMAEFSFTRTLSDLSISTISSMSAPASPTGPRSSRNSSIFSFASVIGHPESPSGSSTPSSPTLSAHSRSGSLTPRPASSGRKSSSSARYSPGWYTPNEHNFTLEDFARKLNTRSKRFEVYLGRCAQNVVMALFSPTPLVLFLFNPISLILWVLVGLWWWSWSSSTSRGETQG